MDVQSSTPVSNQHTAFAREFEILVRQLVRVVSVKYTGHANGQPHGTALDVLRTAAGVAVLLADSAQVQTLKLQTVMAQADDSDALEVYGRQVIDEFWGKLLHAGADINRGGR